MANSRVLQLAQRILSPARPASCARAIVIAGVKYPRGRPDASAPGRRQMALRGIDDDDEDLYYGTYSNFWSSPEQFKGIVVFCVVLGTFFIGGQVLSGLLLPFLLGDGDVSVLTTADYWLKF